MGVSGDDAPSAVSDLCVPKNAAIASSSPVAPVSRLWDD
jgi:hypothetical protein